MKKNIVKIAYENDGSERNTRIEIEDEEMETAQITGWSIEQWVVPSQNPRIEWDGIENEIEKGINGNEYEIWFYGDEKSFHFLKDTLSDITMLHRSNNWEDIQTDKNEDSYGYGLLKQESEENYEIGLKYYNQNNLSEAISYFEKSCKEIDNIKALRKLCEIYLQYLNDEDDGKREKYSELFYKNAKYVADEGDAEDEYYLGNCYYNGEGVEKDEVKAFEWYKKAAEQGHISAQYNVGVCYDNGEGVEKDKRKAFGWYERAAEQGHVEAQYNLGVCYEYGRGVEKDKRKAFGWYERAAEQGLAEAQYNLGVCYEYGRGVEKDENKAFEWYEKAAEQGHVEAAQRYWYLG